MKHQQWSQSQSSKNRQSGDLWGENMPKTEGDTSGVTEDNKIPVAISPKITKVRSRNPPGSNNKAIIAPKIKDASAANGEKGDTLIEGGVLNQMEKM